MPNKIISRNQAADMMVSRGDQFVRIPNPSYVYPPYEICPIAPALKEFNTTPLAAVMDMDGTTTTTETLCIHALEHAVRKAMGSGGPDWQGLDPDRDYPHVIGNSTTKHVEYLADTYGSAFEPEAIGSAFLDAARWTLGNSRDEQRRQQVRVNAQQFGASDIVADQGDAGGKTNRTFSITGREHQVQACIDIYYQRYHEILAAIERNDRTFLDEIPGVDPDRPLIEPMPGVAVTLSLLKGDLGEDAGKLAGVADPDNKFGEPGKSAQILAGLGRFFAEHPVKLALVTSSICYEAEVVMKEVFHVIRDEIETWPVSEAVKARLRKRFDEPALCYDAFVTASDSSEIRLKPFRDLDSIALQQTGVQPEDFDSVIGFEDSQSGTVAIRAAGIGRCIAVPFSETGGHSFDAASFVAEGGLPEVLLAHSFFVSGLMRNHI